MLEIQATPFVEAIARMNSLQATINGLAVKHAAEMGRPVAGDVKELLLAGLRIIADACPGFGGRLTRVAADRLIQEIGRDECSYSEVVSAITVVRERLFDELNEGKLFALNPDDVSFYTGAVGLFGNEAVTAFPSTVSEIDEAGKCLALGRVAATIFHLMRVAEIGLRCLAKPLGIVAPNPDWGQVIRTVDDYVKLPKAQQTLPLNIAFLSGASAQMHAVKLAWRNQVMHVDTTFSLDNARDIFNATKALMQHLSTQLSE